MYMATIWQTGRGWEHTLTADTAGAAIACARRLMHDYGSSRNRCAVWQMADVCGSGDYVPPIAAWRLTSRGVWQSVMPG